MLARLTIALLLVVQSLFGWVCARTDDISQSCLLVLHASCSAAAHDEAAGDCCEPNRGDEAPPPCCADGHSGQAEPEAPKTPCTPERCPECRLLPPPTRPLPARDTTLDGLRPIWSAAPTDPPYAGPIRPSIGPQNPLPNQVDGARPPPHRAALCIWTI